MYLVDSIACLAQEAFCWRHEAQAAFCWRQSVVHSLYDCRTAIWIRDDLPWWLNSRRLNGRQTEYIPVFAIRHTHRTVNAGLAFGNQGNTQENILKLFEQLFRGRVQPFEIEPLAGKLPSGPDAEFGVHSRNNRRLLALRALQSSRLDECIKVPCYPYLHQEYLQSPKFREWFDNVPVQSGLARRPAWRQHITVTALIVPRINNVKKQMYRHNFIFGVLNLAGGFK